ncbi:hypothetical protein Acy02nite_12880 [Actinoplanes cyaneus]|uniref:NlpC/P60 domain-containing protein n=1 Tax=Actinoplanes cyaneus TaxID=52696 RepID=A0A919IFG0_9ACTN|nr:C40 family peptidase [Actinoplanes cyaneus]MCW2137355.1 Cell wall-associated hydrolase, NlpC family [Actinoplanes cyaneus]GID63407.1 hypothetical protein Acy02nite_12880 [Actinoplanes cyaneus]
MSRGARNLLLVVVLGILLSPGVIVLIASAAVAGIANPCGAPSEAAEQVEGTDLSGEQLANAELIVGVVKDEKLPARAAVISLATSMQESSLVNNLRQLDHDSIGLFQQRVSIYGADVAGNPVRSTKAFLAKLVKQPDWQTRPLTEVAADVQIPRADLRGEYAKWEQLATTLTQRFLPGSTTTCADGPGAGLDDGAAGLPDGYQLPTDAQQRTAVSFALAQLGERYVFGANGPDTWDCSSLMQGSWAAAGVAIPRVTYEQVKSGVAVPGLSAMQPGDLVFIPGSLGSATNPRHVGMYIGTDSKGEQWLVQAPKTGDVVKTSKVSSWARKIVSIRRPVDKS